jgi:hypothetical protein
VHLKTPPRDLRGSRQARHENRDQRRRGGARQTRLLTVVVLAVAGFTQLIEAVPMGAQQHTEVAQPVVCIFQRRHLLGLLDNGLNPT